MTEPHAQPAPLPAHRPAIWVHVSTLLNWTRPPVGIIRVEQEYCRWLLQHAETDGLAVRFCEWDRAANTFVEAARERVQAKLAPPAAAQPPAAYQRAAWKTRVKNLLRKAIPLLPAPWVPRLRDTAYRVLHHVLVARARLRSWMARTRVAPDRPVATPAPFGPGDRLVSLGLDWDYLDQKVLYQLKQRHGLRTTLICYDVIPALFPQLVVLPPGGFGAYLVDMAWCADEVLCISHHTRKDCEAVLSRLGAPVPPMHVIHLGSEVHASGEPARAPAGLAVGEGERPFVLFVSTIERRKNHEILYRAWTRLRDQGVVPHRLVFVGMQGWGVTDLLNDMRLDPRTQSDIVLLNHVSDAELDWLYRHAAFTVFPSLYEGWGLPLVESLARGKFCLASSAASLPEAGGPHAEYLDPWDLPAWVDRLGHYMAHPEEVEARNERIRREFRAPSWADTARQIHQVALAAGRGQP
ncbi:MAG: glycosyltransferase family 4 protein [Proteobacteria bacterium]|nr:glycosyltransferase family 4 protein [Pseudomonadota bacterium]